MKFLPRLALMMFLALFLFAPVSSASELDSPLPGDTPTDDITGGLDAMPEHLGIVPFVILVIEILKRTKLLKSNQATWAARALGGVLWLLAVALPADTLADVTQIMAALGALGWALIGSEKLYDFGQSFRSGVTIVEPSFEFPEDDLHSDDFVGKNA